METNARSLVKAVSYRLLGSMATALVVYLLTGRAAVSVSAGTLDLVVKLALYYLHERIWDRIGYGRSLAPRPVES